MNNIFGMIITGGQKTEMEPLVAKRSVSAIPVAGKYRAIDFVLSNMVNSGIDKVGIVTQYSFHSLMDHLGSGKEWDLDRRNDGLFIFPPYLASGNSGWYRGSADGMYHNITFLKRSREDYVLVTTGNCVYRTRYHDMLHFHQDKKADITIMYHQFPSARPEELQRYGIISLAEDNRVIDLKEKPLTPKETTISTGVYIINRDLLIELLEEGAAHGDYDLVRDILISKISQLNVYGYQFKGYWRAVNSIEAFYNLNMDLLDYEVGNELFKAQDRIFTKIKDAVPAKYNHEAEVKRSIIADGCIIEGEVVNSVLFRGVRVGKGAKVINSIIMQGSTIEENVYLENVIFDKEVYISRGRSLKGEPTAPVVIGKSKRII